MVIKAVAKWRDTASVIGTAEDVKKAEDMLAELSDIMESLGAKVKKSASSKRQGISPSFPISTHKLITRLGLPQKSRKAFEGLATEGDLEDLMRVYEEYLGADEDDSGPPPLVEGLLSFDLKDVTKGDLGMEAEAKLDPGVLAKRLGFTKNNLPYQFNAVRYSSGTTPWDLHVSSKKSSSTRASASSAGASISSAHAAVPSPHTSASSSAPFQKLQLHWHQLAGIHSIVRNTFSRKADPDHCTGMLICDQVGLGKTALTISTIAFINQVIALQKKDKARPPMLRTYTLLA